MRARRPDSWPFFTGARRHSGGVAGGGLASIPQAAIRLHKSANQAITSNTNTAVTWDVEDEKLGNVSHSNGTNPSRVTVTAAGLYLVAGQIVWAGNGGTSYARAVEIFKNGATFVDTPAAQTVAEGAGGLDGRHQFAGVVRLALNDYVEIYVKAISPPATGILAANDEGGGLSGRTLLVVTLLAGQ